MNQIGKMILILHGFTPTYLQFELTFCANCWQRGREIHKDNKIGGANKWNDIVRGSIKNAKIHKDNKIGGANKWNDIVRGSIKNAHK